MQIACLAWGSLVWDPGDLPVRQEWFSDGPFLPIEFARESSDGRVTLVLLNDAPVVRSLWALMSVSNLKRAKEALADRERMTSKDKTKNIGYWSLNENSSGLGVEEIAKWADRIDIEAAIWTALPAKGLGNRNEYHSDLADNVIHHLNSPSLSHTKRQNAEQYVRRAPKQIDTEVRRRIEKDLGWMPIE